MKVLTLVIRAEQGSKDFQCSIMQRSQKIFEWGSRLICYQKGTARKFSCILSVKSVCFMEPNQGFAPILF